MATARQAYRMDYASAYPQQSQQQRRMRVERTGARQERKQQSSLLVTAAIMAAIILVTVAVLSFGRIALTNATVAVMIESDSLSSQIEAARSDGISLEMEQSVLSNTYAINAAAKRLGMEAPYAVGTIALSPDVVAVTDDGSLSLSGSVKNLARTQG